MLGLQAKREDRELYSERYKKNSEGVKESKIQVISFIPRDTSARDDPTPAIPPSQSVDPPPWDSPSS